MIAYVVGRVHEEAEPPAVARWTIEGIFLDEASADAACLDPRDFLAPLEVGVRLPDEVTAWPGARYPRVP